MNVELGKKIEYIANTQPIVSKKNKTTKAADKKETKIEFRKGFINTLIGS